MFHTKRASTKNRFSPYRDFFLEILLKLNQKVMPHKIFILMFHTESALRAHRPENRFSRDREFFFLEILFEITLTWEEGCFVQIIWFGRVDQSETIILSRLRCFTYMLTVENDNFFSKISFFARKSTSKLRTPVTCWINQSSRAQSMLSLIWTIF